MKSLAIFFFAAALAIVLAGCSGGSSDSGPTTVNGAGKPPGQIKSTPVAGAPGVAKLDN